MSIIQVEFNAELGEILDSAGLRIPSAIAGHLLPSVANIYQADRDFYISRMLGTYIDTAFENKGPISTKQVNTELVDKLCDAMMSIENESALNTLKKHLYKEGAKFATVTNSNAAGNSFYITVSYRKENNGKQ